MVRWGGRPRPRPDPWSGLVKLLRNLRFARQSRTRASGAPQGVMPHTFPTTELNPWGGSPDPRRAPSPGLSKFQRDPDGRPGGRLRTRAADPQKYVALGCHPAPHDIFVTI